MKRTLYFICLQFLCLSAFAQLKVNANGNIAIKSDEVPLSTLSINCNGSADNDIIMETDKIGATIRRTGMSPGSGNWGMSLSGDAIPVSDIFNVGLRGYTVSKTILSGRAYGLYGRAGNCTSGYNFGVLGVLDGSVNGAGVYGSSDAYDWGDLFRGVMPDFSEEMYM